MQEIGIANLAKTIVSGTDEIHEAEEAETMNMFPTDEEMKKDYIANKTSMERAADAQDPKLDKKSILKEYDLIREVESALGFKPWEEEDETER